MNEIDLNDPVELEGLGLDRSAPDADTLRLIEYLVDRGASREELREAVMSGSLGPLALELAWRGQGERVPFSEAAARAGLETGEAGTLWRALGFPDPVASSAVLTSAQVDSLTVLAGMSRSQLGSDRTLQLARVIGGSIALVAEAIVDAFRVEVEIPRLTAGEPYSQVVEDYARAASIMLPALGDAIENVLGEHMLAVARGAWGVDEQLATVTRERTVGFADLVGYTGSALVLSPAELAAAIGRFESLVGDSVAAAGGRVVKLIGDEAMFVIGDPVKACEAASQLMRTLHADRRLPDVRIGLAAGPVVAHQGDYFGDVVNLAARLVKVAEPGEILVSESVADNVSDRIGLVAVQTPPLKGYEQGVDAFRLR